MNTITITGELTIDPHNLEQQFSGLQIQSEDSLAKGRAGVGFLQRFRNPRTVSSCIPQKRVVAD
jgi:hypothetical protein